jgi:hypothetical protein
VLGPGYATGIGVDANNVYWNDFSAGVIVSCKIGGCENSPTVIAPDQPTAEGVTFDGKNLYWATKGNIVTCVPPGCSPSSTLVTGQSTTITTLTSETGMAYWISSGTLYGSAASGGAGAPRTVTSGILGGSVAVKDGFAYYTNSNSVVSCPVTSSCTSPRTVGSSFQPMGVGSDGADVYWLDGEIANVYRCPVTGCVGGAEVFANQTDIDPSGEVGGNVALDGEYAYWVDATTLYRKHK